MARLFERTKEPKQPSKASSVPDASSLFELFRLAKLLGTTATANAWGILGGMAGDLVWGFWRHHGPPILGRAELMTIGYCVSMAVYTIIMRTQRGVAKTLAFAALMFADGQITSSEYQAMRKACLKRAGLIENR